MGTRLKELSAEWNQFVGPGLQDCPGAKLAATPADFSDAAFETAASSADLQASGQQFHPKEGLLHTKLSHVDRGTCRD